VGQGIAMALDELAEMAFEGGVGRARGADAGVVVGQRGPLAGLDQRHHAILDGGQPQHRPALVLGRLGEQRSPVGVARGGGGQGLVQRVVAQRVAGEPGEQGLQLGDDGGVVVGSHGTHSCRVAMAAA
jgi:hypothetical protein